MTDYGVTLAGFVIKRLEDIKAEIEDKLKASLGPEINLLPHSVLGQLVGIFSERESLVWELCEAIYNSQYPDTSEGAQLDNVVALTGITRKQATKSVGEGIARGTPTTIIPAGSVISVVGDPTSRFVTDNDATIAATLSRLQKITFSDPPDAGAWKLQYASGITSSLAFNATAAQIATALEALAGVGDLEVTGNYTDGFLVLFRSSGDKLDITVNTNTLTETGNPVTITIAKQPGVVIQVSGETTGPYAAPADSLTVIETPVAGWTTFSNPQDIDIGQDLETDQELKLRRLAELGAAGKATTEAIKAALLSVTDVIAVVVFQNNLAVTDIDGRPPHSLDIVVEGGDSVDIADIIFNTIAAGIQTIGSVTENVTDSQGFTQVIKFSRPTDVDIYLEVDLSVDVNLFPADGVTQAEAALLAFGNSHEIGEDVVVYPSLVASLNSIPGITDVVTRIGIAPSPTLDDNIIIDPREIAKFDSARITVTLI